MQLSIDTLSLSNVLKPCMSVIPARPSHLILSNFFLKAQGDFLTVVGFNLSSGISINVEAEIREEGELTVNAQMFTELVEKLSDELIELVGEKDEDGDIKQLLIKSSNGTYNLSTVPASEFPAIPVLSKDDNKIKVNPTLLTGLKKVSPFAATDDTKQILTGINIKIHGGLLSFATSDGHRLSVFRKEDEDIADSTDSFEVTIPVKVIKLFNLIVGDKDVFMALENGNIFVSNVDNYFVARSLEGSYPAYQNLIPKTFEGTVVINRRDLLSCLDRLIVFTKKTTNGIVKVVITKEGSLTLSVDMKEEGNGNERIRVESNIDIIFALNCEYCLETVRAFSSEEIKISVNTPTTPVVFTPINTEDQTVLLMPVQLRG